MFHAVSTTKKTYVLIMDQIMELIREGKIKKGDKLPSERQLAEMLNVGRTSLKQAISGLCSLGIVESRHGDGNYIRQHVSDDLPVPLAAHFYLNDWKISDLVQIRFIIETRIICVVCMNITDEQIAVLEDIVDTMRTVETDKDRADCNLIFHNYLVELFGNELLAKLYKGISGLISHQVYLADGVQFYQNHVDLLNAIKSKDQQLCYKKMCEHFQSKYTNMHDSFFKYF